MVKYKMHVLVCGGTGCKASQSHEIVENLKSALVENGFDGYLRPDHGRNIWEEDAKPGYGLFDRALGGCYLYGLFEAVEKDLKK